MPRLRRPTAGKGHTAPLPDVSQVLRRARAGYHAGVTPAHLARALFHGGPAALQGRVIFGMPKHIRALALGPHAGGYRTNPLQLERPGGVVLEGWCATPVDGPAHTTLLYFGGRNEHVVWAPDMASFLPGHAVYAFNYRGTGASTGWPSEQHARQDALAAHALATRREPQAAGLAIMGRSLGTALAVGLAAELAVPARLVLASPFENVPQAVRHRRMGWALAPLVGQRFDCTVPATACTGDTLVLLAEHDRHIPHAQSLALCARFPRPPRIETVPATTHQSLPRSAGAQAAIARFLLG